MPKAVNRILLVEDNDDHAMLIQSAMAAEQCELVRIANAESAQRYFASEAEPVTLMLVDINLPGMSGLEFLQWVQQAELLVPVVILSTSDNPTDIHQSFKHGASGYLIKPVGLQELKEKLRRLMAYWFEASQLPRPGAN